MLVDFITARLQQIEFPDADWEELRLLHDRVQRICPRTNEVKWETTAWDSVRSDSHSLAFRVGRDALWLQGSPARVCGSGDAVFGEGPAAALDLKGCLSQMIKFLSGHLPVPIPDILENWIFTRVDITQNIMLDSQSEVHQALGYLRACEGGRYKVTAKSGDTVYWSNSSKLRKGKAYAKGPHIQYMLKQKDYTGRPYTDIEQKLANKLLRLEETIGCQYFERKAREYGIKWHQLTPDMLIAEWQSYFNRMIGTAEMTKDTDIRTLLEQSAPTPGQGRAAHGCWLLIQHEGWHKARQSYSERTWYRHMRIFHAAGLGDMDISSGNVVPLRLKILEARQVNTWSELIAA